MKKQLPTGSCFLYLFLLFIQRYAHERLLYAEYLRCLGDVEIIKLLIELIYRGKLVLRKAERFFRRRQMPCG